MQRLTLTLLSAPGLPMGDSRWRLSLSLETGANGQPDAEAWTARHSDWGASLNPPDAPTQYGDIEHDPDFGGWCLRLADEGHGLDDAALESIQFPGISRPGEVLVTRAPDGTERAWRIVEAITTGA
ncbi:hypothetical protein EOD42_13155 [Rhodovarius crocodyli]|uniref:Uncharacterized protein n=1 Tax=Rhodovarius crocodyli TaxID=1979269 RepID=A0A437MEJ9_9PROT|nr:hypothetical protein [Rhodovarius crocodyli]RVT96068.1 hypothetical protein EOD42_13155 [Rhodovarius crocodyli]